MNCANTSHGEIGFCNCNTCSENEGDCDAHDECQDGLACGSNNCPASLGFDSEVDCCYPNSCPGTCGNPTWKGDNYCDDQNNNCGCEWDGGDCCGNDVNTQYCSACECLDPNAGNSRKHTIIKSITDNRRKKNHRKNSVPRHPRHLGKENRMSKLRPQQFGRNIKILQYYLKILRGILPIHANVQARVYW